MFKCCYLVTTSILLFSIETCMMEESSELESGHYNDGGDENWAIVPYESMQNALFPAFNERIRKFQFENVEKEIVITQNWDGQGVSAVVWEAAVELSDYLAKNMELKGTKVLELGSGTGLVGMVCAKLGADVIVTDLKEALPSLARNVDLNFQAKSVTAPQVRELKWGQNLSHFDPHYDIIIGADVIYIEDTFDDLLDTICYLAGCKGYESLSRIEDAITDIKTNVLISAKMRYSREENFLNRMKKFFVVDLISENTDTNIHIYKAVPL